MSKYVHLKSAGYHIATLLADFTGHSILVIVFQTDLEFNIFSPLLSRQLCRSLYPIHRHLGILYRSLYPIHRFLGRLYWSLYPILYFFLADFTGHSILAKIFKAALQVTLSYPQVSRQTLLATLSYPQFSRHTLQVTLSYLIFIQADFKGHSILSYILLGRLYRSLFPILYSFLGRLCRSLSLSFSFLGRLYRSIYPIYILLGNLSYRIDFQTDRAFPQSHACTI